MATPLTPMEQGGTWATPSEEVTFLDGVAESPRATYDAPSMSDRGTYPIHRVTVTEAPENAPVVMIVGGQHGNEPASREGALRWVRDLAYTTEPAWVDLLGRARFVAIPTANPHGTALASRYTPLNPTGVVDINRDHLAHVLAESRLIATTIRDYRPVLVVDMHEIPTANMQTVMLKESHITPADDGLKVIGREIAGAVKAALDAEGIPHAPYAQSTDPTTLNNNAALRGTQCILLETPTIMGGVGVDGAVRVGYHALMVNAIMGWLSTNLDALAEVTRGARDRYTARGVSRSEPFVADGVVINPAPVSYRNLATWPAQLDRLGIVGTTGEVSMIQPAMPLIPYVLDPESSHRLTEATRHAPPLPAAPTLAAPGTPKAVRANVNGEVREVTLIRMGTEDGPVTIWESAAQ